MTVPGPIIDLAAGTGVSLAAIMARSGSRVGACLSISRGRDRGRFPRRRGGADAGGLGPNKEATTPHEGKSARSRRVGKDLCSCATVGFDRAVGFESWGVCGVARLVHSIHYGPRRAPCIRSLSLPTRLT